jgi:two-component system, chemotaxis family, chemotaxis protein CheY
MTEAMTMRVLIVEDDFISRNLLQHFLSKYGHCDIAVDGKEATQAFEMAWNASKPYDLVCMDIMMPEMDGHQALSAIRDLEKQKGLDPGARVKVIMTTCLEDKRNVSEAYYKGGVDAYFVKPIDPQKLIQELTLLRLIENPQ